MKYLKNKVTFKFKPISKNSGDSAHFNPNTNSITLYHQDNKKQSLDTLFHEMFHALQYDKGYLTVETYYSSYYELEFETYVTCLIYAITKYNNLDAQIDYWLANSEPEDTYKAFIAECIDEIEVDHTTVNYIFHYNKFKNNVTNYYSSNDSFINEIKKRSDSGKDASELRNVNYIWHWKQYFDFLGIDTSK